MPVLVVDQDCYRGPLDLLVHLVHRGEVDVLEIAIAPVASLFLGSLDQVSAADFEEAGDFLVLAATLMEMKSRRILPKVESETEAHDQAEETSPDVLRQLLEYRRFQEVAAILWERAREHRRMLRRLASDRAAATTDPALQPIRELELWDLVSAFGRLVRENVAPPTDHLAIDPTPLYVHMERLAARVSQTGGIGFFDLLGTQNTRAQLINKFLALLELIKCGEVWIEISGETGEIRILPPRLVSQEPPSQQAESIPMADPSIPPDVLARDGRTLEDEPAVPEPPDDPWSGPADQRHPDAWQGFQPIAGDP